MTESTTRTARTRTGLRLGMALLVPAALLLAALPATEDLHTKGKLVVRTAVPVRTSAALGADNAMRLITVYIGHSARGLNDYFHRLDYRLMPVRGGAEVPRVYVRELPRDMAGVQPVARRKALFLRSVLPLVLRENEQQLRIRERLLALRERLAAGEPLAAPAQDWLAEQQREYGTAPGDLDELLRRVDVVPASLALAQAATESAWGTSRFVKEGNALYGLWTWSDGHPGIVPTERPQDASYRVRAFASLAASVRAYMHTLNTHWAYADFRRARERMRVRGRTPDGPTLARSLSQFSVERLAYTLQLRAVIADNRLHVLDAAALTGGSLVANSVADTGTLPGR